MNDEELIIKAQAQILLDIRKNLDETYRIAPNIWRQALPWNLWRVWRLLRGNKQLFKMYNDLDGGIL